MATEKVTTSLKAKILMAVLPSLLLFMLAETATRAYVWYNYGRHNYGQRWTFEYEPYLLVKKSVKPHAPYPAKGERFRILLLGGSTMYLSGYGPWKKAFEAFTDREVEVINLGERGYILNQEQIMLTLYGMKHKPDLVITLDGINDFVTTIKMGKPGVVYHSDFIKLGVERPVLNAFFSLLKRSQLVNGLNKLVERRRESRIEALPEYREITVDHVLQGWDNIATICKGMEIPCIISLQPYLHLRPELSEGEKALRVVQQYHYRKQYMIDFFREMGDGARAYDFPGETYFVDATRAFDRVDQETDVFTDEVHISDEADFLLTAYIAATANEQGLVLP